MKKIIKYFLLSILFLLIIKISLSLFFNFIYYPNHPTTHSTMEIYQQFRELGTDKLSEKQLVPIAGGCFNKCSGKDIRVKCVTDSYGRQCEYQCYGYLYSTCHGVLEFIKYSLAK